MNTKRKVALITGGSRGIGLGVARSLAKEGFALVINGRRPEADVKAVLDELRTQSVPAIYCQADIADRTARSQMLDTVRREFGALHVLVNNAGVAPDERRDMLEATEESFERLIRVNLQGPYFLTQKAATWMIQQRQTDPTWRGCIVNVSSISAVVASTSRGEYCVSKAGLSMATQLWAARLGEHDIPVYEVRPGITRTDMTEAVREKYDAMLAAGLCVQPRWGEPQDIGKAVAMLARGDLAYSTGQVLMVDGGLTLRRL
ncbi:MAG: 3-ketoacyl-ACP reductase [Phycisphaeraceae bacterium]|nr:3-ketoacyl-ACP reductase [Phycisphaeraceae bacterium]